MTPPKDLPDLTKEKLNEIILRVCQEANALQDGWTFQPADAETLNAAAKMNSAPLQGPTPVDTSLLWGCCRCQSKTTTTTTTSQDSYPFLQLCTFYLAYSTWQGRVIFMDYSCSDTTSKDDAATTQMWTRLLARIGMALHCRRLVWRHRQPLPSSSDAGPVPIETLHGWLTLYWKLPEMQSYAPYREETTTTAPLPSLRQAFVKALEQSKHDRFRLRLATQNDIDTIDRLVLGLAEFENEPESYILSKQQMQQDGFAGQPLYYCILVDDVESKDGTDPYTCAMAFCYVGYHLLDGRFLYLEDLFFEKKYRGQGGGKFVMSTLARVAQSLHCSMAVWQALDWNTPALNFYNSLGARVQEGLITSRFAGEALEEVAKLPLLDD